MILSYRKRLFWVVAGVVLLTSCQNKQEQIVPSSAFNYDFARSDLKYYLSGYPVGTSIKLTNKSTDGENYLWDFGDGTTSTQKEPTISYNQSGTYAISLTTTSATGSQRTTTQSIKILDCVLKTITISQFKWNSIGEVPTWDNTKKADLTIEIGQHVGNDPPLTVSNLLYRSSPLKDVANTTVSFTIPVTQKVVLNPAMIQNFQANLYGNDGSGNRIVYSSRASGGSYSAYLSTVTKYYTITSGPVTLECTYE